MSPQGGAGRGSDTVVEMSPPPEGRDIGPPSSLKRTESNESSEDSVDSARGNEELQEMVGQNHYEVRKNVVHAIMNVPLLTANVSQLRSIISSEAYENSFYHCVLGFIIISLSLQVVFFALIIGLHVRERIVERREKREALQRLRSRGAAPSVINGRGRRRLSYSGSGLAMTPTALEVEPNVDCVLDALNYFSLVVVFLITIMNMLILGFMNVPEHNSATRRQ